MSWWNHIPEHIKPTIFEIGAFELRYYGLMYVVGITVTWFLAAYRIKNEKDRFDFSSGLLGDYFLWAVLATMAGGRLGYVLFYNLGYYMAHPLQIISPFDFSNGFEFIGLYGMSYHGALIGIFLATLIFCRKKRISFWQFGDLIVSGGSLGYTFGRIGNFLNGELYGRATAVPWGMYFPSDPTGQLRHPSQLYEAFGEGVLLFILLWSLRKKCIFDGFLFSLYLIGYGVVRFVIEFFRQPDEHLGTVGFSLTMGQVLCLAMIAGGGLLMLIFRRKKQGN